MLDPRWNRSDTNIPVHITNKQTNMELWQAYTPGSADSVSDCQHGVPAETQRNHVRCLSSHQTTWFIPKWSTATHPKHDSRCLTRTRTKLIEWLLHSGSSTLQSCWVMNSLNHFPTLKMDVWLCKEKSSAIYLNFQAFRPESPSCK